MITTTLASARIGRHTRGRANIHHALVCAASLLAASCSDSTAPARTPSACVLGALAQDAEVTSSVGGGDCSLDLGGTRVGYVDYAIEMQQGERYLFTLLAKTAWRPTLEIIQPQHHDSLLVMGWMDFSLRDTLWSETIVVSPYNGAFTLRVLGNSEKSSAYTLRSRRCGGSAVAISGTAPFAANGSIVAGSCVVHGDFMYADSANADLYVLHLGVSESRFITVKRTSGNLQPGVMVTGPFYVRPQGMSRMMAMTAGDSVYMTVIGNATPGDYILAVGSGNYGPTGGYRFTVSPLP
jgi:hypothetical protein